MWAGFLEGIEKTFVALLAKIKHQPLKLFPNLESVGIYQDMIDNEVNLVIRMAILARGKEDRITHEVAHKFLKDINDQS